MPSGLNSSKVSHFVSKYKQGSTNVVADALSRRYSILSILDARILGFDLMKEHYKFDERKL